MGTVTEVKARFERIVAEFGQLIVSTYKDTEDRLVFYNKEQMLDGLDSKGKALGEPAPMTKDIKGALGLQTDWIDLKFTGEFQSAMYAKELTEDYAELSSTDWKTSELTGRFGDDIFGLSPENTKEYARESFFYTIIEKIKAIWQK